MGRPNSGNGRQFLDIPLANGHARSASTANLEPSLQLSTTTAASLREESTRVQLQKQRLKEQEQQARHATVVVSRRIPGYKTSAGTLKLLVEVTFKKKLV